jgi:hypothetical protein
MRWAGCVACIEGNRISNRCMMQKSVVKRLLGRLGLRWDDNIKMDFKEMKWEGVDWIDFAHKRNQWLDVLNTIMKLRVLYNVENFLTREGSIRF